MNRAHAKIIAETITYEQLVAMFDSAKVNVKDWKAVSAVNKGMTKGFSWNILKKGLTPNIMTQKLAIKNMIWEFGDHLPENLKIKNVCKKQGQLDVVHQDPVF
tara:strand:+ start:820 stop:1128 length:309 start_codon:yes stop_codon:yes gene_type:complete